MPGLKDMMRWKGPEMLTVDETERGFRVRLRGKVGQMLGLPEVAGQVHDGLTETKVDPEPGLEGQGWIGQRRGTRRFRGERVEGERRGEKVRRQGHREGELLRGSPREKKSLIVQSRLPSSPQEIARCTQAL